MQSSAAEAEQQAMRKAMAMEDEGWAEQERLHQQRQRDDQWAEHSDDIMWRRANEIADANGLNSESLGNGEFLRPDGTIQRNASGLRLSEGPDSGALTPGYLTNRGEWLPDTNKGVVPFGDIVSTQYAPDNVPEGMQSAFGPIRAAYDQIGQGYWHVPTDADGGFRIMSLPESYEMPSLAAFQGEALVDGAIDGLEKLPGAVWDTGKAAVDGWRMLVSLGMGGSGRLKTPLSNLAQSTQAGKLTLGKVAVGLMDATPIGFLVNAKDGHYYQAGGSLTGTAVGLAGGPATSFVVRQANRLPVLGHGVVLEDIGASGMSTSQTGAVRITMVGPNSTSSRLTVSVA